MRCVWWNKQNNTEEDLWIRDIIAETADKYRILPDHILGPRRSANVVKARREAMYRARTETNSSYLKLARIFKRDHSTVIYNVNKYAD